MTREDTRRAIVHNARELETSLRCADFAATDPSFRNSAVAEGMRKLASFYAATAWGLVHAYKEATDA